MGYYRTHDSNPLRHINLQDMSRMHNHMDENQMWGIRNAMASACEAGILPPEWYMTLDYVLTQWKVKLDVHRKFMADNSLLSDAVSMFIEHPDEARQLWDELCAVPVPNTGSWNDRVHKIGKAYRKLHPEEYDPEELD